ncbi:MAG: hypothetical protein RJA36_3730 [Pseudomonadota bacterium]|jgi:hypothetical protein
MYRRQIHPAAAPDYAVCWLLETAVFAAAASSVIGAAGAIQAGQGAQAAANFNAASMRQQAQMQAEARNQQLGYNQQLAAVQEAELRTQQAREAEAIRQRGRRILGAQRAGMAKAGVELTEGTPLEILADQTREIELQAADSAYAADVTSRKIRTGLQSESYATAMSNAMDSYFTERRASLAIAEGRNARTASYYQAGSSLLGGASNAARLYLPPTR